MHVCECSTFYLGNFFNSFELDRRMGYQRSMIVRNNNNHGSTDILVCTNFTKSAISILLLVYRPELLRIRPRPCRFYIQRSSVRNKGNGKQYSSLMSAGSHLSEKTFALVVERAAYIELLIYVSRLGRSHAYRHMTLTLTFDIDLHIRP